MHLKMQLEGTLRSRCQGKCIKMLLKLPLHVPHRDWILLCSATSTWNNQQTKNWTNTSSMSRREHCPRPGGHRGYLGGKTHTHKNILGHLETRHEQHGDVLFIKFMSQTSCYVVAPFKFCPPLPSWGHLQSPDAYFRRWRKSSLEL